MNRAEQACQAVGGRTVLGAEIAHGLDLIQAIRRGFPVGAVQYLLDNGQLSLSELDHAVMPRKTWSNRKRVGTLTAEQSDRLLRVARILALAEEVFADRAKGQAWLRRPTASCRGERPIDLLDTEQGVREVETLLGRIAHGIAA